MKVSALNARLSLALGCLALVSGLAAENSSLSDSNLETAETRVTPETSLSQTDLLRKQVSLDRETQKTLTESLAVSNAEAELFRRKYSELQLRMETLGVEAVSKDRAKLEQRLLKAVSDLQLMNKEKSAYREQLLKLAETMLRFVKSTQSADPQARMEVEAQLRATNLLLAGWDGASPNEEAAPDSDERPGDQCEGRVVARGWQPRCPTGSETRDAAASGAGREDDRDFARGGCARENQWRGRFKNWIRRK